MSLTTLAGSDITCDLYDNTGTNGRAGSPIETGKLPSATITAAGWYTFTGFTTSLTTNTPYWLVFKNANATPASNNCTFRFATNLTLASGYLNGINQGGARLSWSEASSTNSGSTWSGNNTATCLRVGYSDSTYDGLPVSNVAAAASADRVYSARESGVKFTSPANATLNVAGISMMLAAVTGTPTANPKYGLWFGSSPVNQGYTVSFPNGPNNFSNVEAAPGQFASNIQIPPSTIVRVTLAEDTQSDTSSNGYNLTEFTWDTDSNSVILLPWNGTATKTYYNGSSWSDSALGTSLFGHALLLDTAGEFGGGAVVSSPFPGGVW